MNRRNALISTGLFPLSMGIWKNIAPINLDVPEGLKILFQGDSITDAGRNRGSYYANDGWESNVTIEALVEIKCISFQQDGRTIV
jgi:hypothetical protein